MRSLAIFTTGALALSSAAIAQDNGICEALYDRVAVDFDINFQQCVMGTPSFTLDECTPPHDFEGAIPTTHLILAMDVSGSMAGRVGGETKMAVAQREATSFLNDLGKEVSVGLMLYGHTGDNTEAGKVESCASPEMVHAFDAPRAALRDTIGSLTPTGWTPLGGTLNRAGEVLEAVPGGSDTLAHVVYLISDGEETCDSGPVAAAERLANSGIQTTVNTIGFAVDSETQDQLQAIADAGGGTYYPAENASALNAVLRGIQDSEASYHRYQHCANLNAGQISGAYQRTANTFQQCAMQYDPSPLQRALMAAVQEAEAAEQPEGECLFPVLDRLRAETGGVTFGFWLNDNIRPMLSNGNQAVVDYYESLGLGR